METLDFPVDFMADAGRATVQVYMGEGQGKTMAALGLAIRSAGHGYRSIVIQFMKGRRDTGEYRIAKRLGPEYEIHQFGREEFMDLNDPAPEDFEMAARGLDFAREILAERPKLLILDELGLAASVGLVEVSEVMEVIESASPDTVLVITGRRVPEEIVSAGDLVTEMIEVKHPLRSGVGARKGLEY